MRISDWSSDVCSSDLRLPHPLAFAVAHQNAADRGEDPGVLLKLAFELATVPAGVPEIGADAQARVRLLQLLRLVGIDAKIKLEGSFRSEERRVGKECVSTFRSRRGPYH